MKTFKRAGIMLLIMAMMFQTIIYAAVDTTVEITKNDPVVVLTNEGERIFDIEYVFDVDYEQVLTGLDIVLVLDRSNSMLRVDPSTGLPVADAVWKATNDFVTEVYEAYPESSLAIVPFGTNAVKMDNWKFKGDLQLVLDEITAVYDYRDLRTDYESNFSHYLYNGYDFAWENWQISDGGTNIKAAFESSVKTAELRQIRDKSTNQSIVLLFTDGVATLGGSNSQRNYNYPLSHNSNTIAAYTAGQAAQQMSEIITVGYFEGIEYEETQEVARDTLMQSQNAGFFEASETAQLTGIFDTIVEELNFIGTDARVVEIIEDEFEVVEGSILPDNYTLTTDEFGRQVISWPLGNVIDSNYTFGYQVRVKDHVYPTGSGTVEIPINEMAMLHYTDLEGNPVSEPLGQNFTTIPPRSNQPQVTVDITYLNNQFGYLIGDEIQIDHQLNYTNEIPFDYVSIDVNQFQRTAAANDLTSYLALSQESTDAGWSLDGNTLANTLAASHTVNGSENLEWSASVPIKLTAVEDGSTQLQYAVDYVLTNSVGLQYDFVSSGSDPGVINIKEGQVVIQMTDDYGVKITDVQVYVDGVLAETEINSDGYVAVKNVTSGTHTISFETPSGYLMLTPEVGFTVDADKNIVFDATLSYNNPLVTKTFDFERLEVRDIKITTRDNQHAKATDQIREQVPSKMNFTLTRPLTKIVLNMVDDYGTSDHIFDLDESGADFDVRNQSGVVVPGFVMNGNKLSYDGAELPAGIYTAYGVVTPPATLGNGLDYDYNVDVDQVTTREATDTEDTVLDMTSNGLFVGLVDNEGPVINAVHDEAASTLNLINQDITINDKTEIVTYEVYAGTLTYEEILAATETLVVDVVEDLGNSVSLDGDITVDLALEEEGYVTRGSITIYAVDAFGNYSVLVVEYENTDVNELLDEDLV